MKTGHPFLLTQKQLTRKRKDLLVNLTMRYRYTRKEAKELLASFNRVIKEKQKG